jgi:CRISPR-associated endoribonuclease Cas6
MLQGLIYSQLEPNLASWLHGAAYQFAKRTYKMFTFSRLAGNYNLDKRTKRITFTGPVSFKLASHTTDVLASLAEHLLKSEQLRLGQHQVQVSGVEILTPPSVQASTPTRVRALSPITIYSTFEKPGGGKLTHYYAPREKDWGEMILGNLARKAGSLEWDVNTDEALKDAYIKPINTSDRDKKVVRYKNFVMEAWLGTYELKLPEGFFELAYDVGLGGKNAQGFGMVEVVG